MAKANRYTLLSIAEDTVLWDLQVGITERNSNCECSWSETVDCLLNDCTPCESECGYPRETSPELDFSDLLDSKKDIEAAATFLDSQPHLLS